MTTETGLVIVLFCAALLPLLGAWGRVRTTNRVVWFSVVALWLGMPVTLVWAALSFWQPVVERPQPDNRPIEVHNGGYVGSKTCRSCHPNQHASWKASYHRTMTQLATPESVLAPFEGEILEDGIAFQAKRNGDQFSVLLPYPYEERPIVMTTGSHHMQVYWFPPHDGSRYLGLIPFAYLKDEARWLPRRAIFLQPPEWTTEFKLGHWNQSCIECHVTNGKMRPQIRPDGNWSTGDVDSQVSELTISCEACHGPGDAHVRANQNPLHRYRRHFDETADDTIVNPSRLPHDLSSQVCGQCHGVLAVEDWRRWAENGNEFQPGMDLTEVDTRFLVDYNAEPRRPEVQFLADEKPDFFQDHFWADTTIRVAGREYNGLIESPCFQRGEMSCLSCHEMHPGEDDPRALGEWANDQLHHQMQGDQACLQCHEQYSDSQALVAHTHHSAESTGSRCYNCHMPYTTYGLLKGIRSHRIETPSVATSVATGRPNGCNQCHLDKTLAWSAGKLSDWYGIEAPELSEDEQTIAASVLWLLKGDAAQRAILAWTLGWDAAKETSGTDWIPPYLIELLEDPYQAVRLIAARSLRKLPGFEDFEYNWPTSPEIQARDRRRGLQVWSQMTKQPAPAVLVGEDGDLVEQEFYRLLKQRNDRPVFVAE